MRWRAWEVPWRWWRGGILQYGSQAALLPHMDVKYRIVPTREVHIKSLNKALDRVAREKKYISFLKAPPLAESRKYFRGNIKDRNPQFVALAGEEVIGWRHITPIPRDTYRHCAALRIPLAPELPGHRIRSRLPHKALAPPLTL